ncbi:hypothetical protein LINPERPRIM_LOCUS8825 [Linum perenne]
MSDWSSRIQEELRKSHFCPIQVTELVFRATDSIIEFLQEIPEHAADHRSFLRRAGAGDHETVYWWLKSCPQVVCHNSAVQVLTI